jgi:hypothetical protein
VTLVLLITKRVCFGLYPSTDPTCVDVLVGGAGVTADDPPRRGWLIFMFTITTLLFCAILFSAQL